MQKIIIAVSLPRNWFGIWIDGLLNNLLETKTIGGPVSVVIIIVYDKIGLEKVLSSCFFSSRSSSRRRSPCIYREGTLVLGFSVHSSIFSVEQVLRSPWQVQHLLFIDTETVGSVEETRV
jgi:hypothetical protein